MATFVVQLVFGDDREHLQQVRPQHREYCRELGERGVLLAGGPYVDGDGAILVYETADADELQRVLAADPYAEAGVIASADVREWTPRTGAWVQG